MGNTDTISEQVIILHLPNSSLKRRDQEPVACLSPGRKMKLSRRTVEVMNTPVKETLTLEVKGNSIKETLTMEVTGNHFKDEESAIPLSPIKMVSSKNSR